MTDVFKHQSQHKFTVKRFQSLTYATKLSAMPVAYDLALRWHMRRDGRFQTSITCMRCACAGQHRRSQFALESLGIAQRLPRCPMSRSALRCDDSDSKRRRLGRVVGLKGVTGAALSAVLSATRDERIEPLSEWQIRDFIKSEFKQVGHVIKLPLKNGACFAWEICRPDKLIQYFASASDLFREAAPQALSSAGAAPLDTIWYLDEVVPGNVLKPENHRKFWTIYMAISGCDNRFAEQFWLPVAVLRSGIASSVRGGVSQCMRSLFRSVLFDPCRMAEVGAPIVLDVPVLARLSIKHIIGDEGAIKYLWDSKGASGIRPCFFCCNVVSKHSGLASGCRTLVDTGCTDPRRFQLCSNADIWNFFDKLAENHNALTKAAFTIQERASGADACNVAAQLGSTSYGHLAPSESVHASGHDRAICAEGSQDALSLLSPAALTNNVSFN